MQVPLFPLNTVLFPCGPLPLRIFEARYLDMIGDCMKHDTPFGVLLIRDGAETGPAETFSVGTLARIADWYQGSDGLLGVTAVGDRRFRLLSSDTRNDGLNVGDVEVLADAPAQRLPDDFASVAKILDGILDDLGRLYEGLERRLDDAGWVSYRFVEILPVDLLRKQECLERDDPQERLELVREMLESVRGPAGK